MQQPERTDIIGTSIYSTDFQEKLNAKFADDVAVAKALGNNYPIDIYGRFPWDRSELRGRATFLSKASIGAFCYAVLSAGGEISSIWPFNANYGRSAIFYRVRLSIAQKYKIEAETTFRFDPPPTVSLA